MSSGRHDWSSLETELDRLLALDPAARAQALEVLQRDDAARAQALRGWLADIDASEGRFEPTSAAARMLPPDGPWRLLRPLGSGGMGEVWLAERADGAFERYVAIKRLRIDRGAMGQRLARERELLARLRHPGIAMLLDGGLTVGGVPYLVTEWVDGERLDHWLRDARPDLRVRVQVLQRIAEAVGYAHANLIVHRDLKPANVMIDRDGAPRLLDFGIARLMHEVDAATLTQDGALTPAFASPEQLLGEAITTRSDIYALGALLYWLVCGHAPHARETLPLAALIERVCHHDPAPPSSLAGSPAASGARDLDAIALKALARRPAERYPSADALVRDLSRWLDGESVSVRLPSRTERWGRALRRHRLAAALAATSVLALGAGILGTAWQARESARQRDAAVAQADRSEHLLDLFAQLFREAEGEERLSASEWLDRAVQAQDGRTPVDRGTRLRMLALLAGIEQDRGQADRARQLLERVLQEDDGLLEPPVRAAAHCRLGSAHAVSGRSTEARTQIEAGIAQAEALSGAERLALIDCLQALAASGVSGDRPGPEHEAAARRALQEIDALDTQRDMRWRRAGTLYVLGTLLDTSGRFADAAAAYAEVAELDVQLGNLDTVDHAAVITAQAGALARAGRPRDADARFAEGTALARRVGGRTPNLATDLSNHAMVKIQLGQHEAAAALARESIALLAELAGANPIALASAYLELGKAALLAGDLAGAHVALQEAGTRMSAIEGAERRLAPIAVWSARLALARGDLTDARRRIDAVIAELRAAGSSGGLADALQVSADVASAEGDALGAEALAREALDLLRAHPAPSPLALARAELGLATRRHARSGSDAESRRLAARALAVFESAYGAHHAQTRAARTLAEG